MTGKEEFCEQIRECEKAMYCLAFSVVKNDADASEIISESIFRAYKNLDSLKSNSSFKPWVLKIVHNTAAEFVRKNSKIVYFDDVHSDLESNESFLTTSISLRDAVESLSQPYRTVIVLYYYENFSISQISKITDLTNAAVKQQLSRARKQLRTILKEDFRNG